MTTTMTTKTSQLVHGGRSGRSRSLGITFRSNPMHNRTRRVHPHGCAGPPRHASSSSLICPVTP
jgi:hypothetical protein